MILYNPTDAQDLDTDTHWVPSAHVNFTDGKRVKDAIARGPITASLTAGQGRRRTPARVMAAFSSRGPQKAVPDIPKPDVTAPGVQILAGAADQPAPSTMLRPGFIFQAIQGTSMASPHVAGAGALLTQAHPTLSPAELKSELMLTANPNVNKEDGKTPADVFDRGSGEIDPNKAADSGPRPGRQRPTTTSSYLEYVDPTIVTGDIPKTAPERPQPGVDLVQQVRRIGLDDARIQERRLDRDPLDGRPSRGCAGIQASTPTGQFFTIKPGQTQAITVNLKVTTAPLNQYTFGALVLTSGSRTLRVPISLKPVPVAAPAKVTVSTANAAGTQAITVNTELQRAALRRRLGPGDAGRPGRQAHLGHRPAARTRAARDPGTQLYPVTVPAGSQLLSTRLANVDDGAAGTDLDLYLYRDADGDGNFANATLVGVSGSGGVGGVDHARPAPAGGQVRGRGRRLRDARGRVGLRPRHVGGQRPVAGRSRPTRPGISVSDDGGDRRQRRRR